MSHEITWDIHQGVQQVDLGCWSMGVGWETGVKCLLMKSEHVPASIRDSLEGFRQKAL